MREELGTSKMSLLEELEARLFENKRDEIYSGIMVKYLSLLESKKTFSVSFSIIDENDNLACYDEDVKLVLKQKDAATATGGATTATSGRGFHHYNLKFFKKLRVRVSSVDQENNIVYCELDINAFRSVFSRFSEAEKELYREVVIEGNNVSYLAKVVGVGNYGIKVDILDQGIFGYISKRNYKISYTSDIAGEASKLMGYYIKVMITGYDVSRRQWVCSRKALMEDPWKDIESKFKPGDILLVKCVSLRPDVGTGYFFGAIKGYANENADRRSDDMSGFTELEVMVNFPDTDTGKMKVGTIMEGQYYLCKVKKVSQEQKVFKAVAIDSYNLALESRQRSRRNQKRDSSEQNG